MSVCSLLNPGVRFPAGESASDQKPRGPRRQMEQSHIMTGGGGEEAAVPSKHGRFGWYPHFLLHPWPLTSNYFLLPGMCPSAVQRESVKQYVHEKKKEKKNKKRAGLLLKGGNHSPVGLFKCLTDCGWQRAAGQRWGKVESRQESIKSTSGVALVPRITHYTHTHTHTHTHTQLDRRSLHFQSSFI